MLDNTTAAQERGLRRFKPPSKLGRVHVFTSVLSSVTMVHIASSINISCTARCQLIH